MLQEAAQQYVDEFSGLLLKLADKLPSLQRLVTVPPANLPGIEYLVVRAWPCLAWPCAACLPACLPACLLLPPVHLGPSCMGWAGGGWRAAGHAAARLPGMGRALGCGRWREGGCRWGPWT
jgi:hypothetical protein